MLFDRHLLYLSRHPVGRRITFECFQLTSLFWRARDSHERAKNQLTQQHPPSPLSVIFNWQWDPPDVLSPIGIIEAATWPSTARRKERWDSSIHRMAGRGWKPSVCRTFCMVRDKSFMCFSFLLNGWNGEVSDPTWYFFNHADFNGLANSDANQKFSRERWERTHTPSWWTLPDRINWSFHKIWGLQDCTTTTRIKYPKNHQAAGTKLLQKRTLIITY